MPRYSDYDPVAWEHIFTTVLKIKLRSFHVAVVNHSWISQAQQHDRHASCDWIADNIEISVWLSRFVSCESAERGAVTITQTNYSKLLTTNAHMTLLSYTHTRGGQASCPCEQNKHILAHARSDL